MLVFFYPKANAGLHQPGLRSADVADQVGTPPSSASARTCPTSRPRSTKYSLGYPLLSDPEHKVAEAYGVWGEKKLYGRAFMGIIRSAFLIDEKGKVEQAWYKISPKDTPLKLLAALKD